MRRCSAIFLLYFLLLSAVAGLSGCAGFGGGSNAVSPVQISPGAIHGSNYGGHAPIIGAKLFLLEAEAGGYGGAATSLLPATTAGAAQDLNGSATTNPTYGMYYLTTDLTGAFNITGDYSCTAGHPVYLYAQGGSPTYPSSSNVFQVPTVTVTSNPSGGDYITFTTSTTENAYVGEQLTFAGFDSQDNLNLLNGVVRTVTSANLTTNTVTIATGSSSIGTYTEASASITLFPTNNPGIVNLAMLGLCPGTTNEFADTLKFVYMNEVSTTAMTYAMSAFATNTASTPTVTDAVHFGTSATNLVGLQNAALTAGQLYDIQGSNLSSTYAGEGHIARPKTPAGNGIVPQATVDTIANILASCVDSNNTYSAITNPAGTQSSQCLTLFANATTTADGAGVQPNDIATAAINIAQHPGGPAGASSTTNNNYMNALFTLPTGNVPFAPYLTSQPNDFLVAINYPLALNSAVNGAESLGIDASGNVWMNSQGLDNIFEFSPLGVLQYSSPAQSYSYGYVSVDPGGNVWSGGNFAQTKESEFLVNTSGAVIGINQYNAPILGATAYDQYVTVTDTYGNAYTSATTSSIDTQWQLFRYTAAGVGTVPNVAPVNRGYTVAHGAIDGSQYVWLTTELGSAGTTNYEISRVQTVGFGAGLVAPNFPITKSTSGATPICTPEEPAIDSGNNLWVANQANNGDCSASVTIVTPAGAISNPTGGVLSRPFGTAADGLGGVWITNRGVTTVGSTVGGLMEYNDATSTVISPTSSNYNAGGLILAPLNVAGDPSGNLWITSFDTSAVYEVIGTAAPTTTPLSYASGHSGLGARP